MKVTMRDIAKHANTSVATVSYVLNNTNVNRISDATRQRVLQSAKELHYTPDAAAKSFKTGIRNMVGFIGPAVDNFFWAVLVENMERVFSNHGYNLIITNARENPERELSDIKLLSSGLVDGLILESTLSDCSIIDQNVPKDFPIVFIDRSLKNCNHDAIFISNYSCMYEGVHRLISSGHKKIGYIAGLYHLSTTVERLRAYRDAMSDCGIFEDGYIRYEDRVDCDLSEQISSLLALGCTALVTSNSRMTYSTAIWLKTNELSDSIALLGYHDDTRDFGMIQSVGLISQPAAIMGQKAAEAMINRLEKPSAPIDIVSLQSELHWFSQNNR